MCIWQLLGVSTLVRFRKCSSMRWGMRQRTIVDTAVTMFHE